MKISEYEVPASFLFCNGCNSSLHRDAFPRRFNADGTSRRAKLCRGCIRRRKIGRRGVHEAKAILDDARNVPCCDCQQRLPLECMGLVPPEDAPFCPSKEAGRVSLARLRAVVKTCAPVCANCRAIRQANARKSRPKPVSIQTDTPTLRAVLAATESTQTRAESAPDLAQTQRLKAAITSRLEAGRVGEEPPQVGDR